MREKKRSELTVGLSPGQFIPTHYRQHVVPPVRTKWSSWQHCTAFSVYIARIKKCQIDGSRLGEIVRPLPRWPLVAGQCGESSSAPFSPSPRSLTAPCVSLITSMTMICEGSQCSIANHGDLPQPTSQWKPRVAMMLTLSSLVTRRMSLWLTTPPVQWAISVMAYLSIYPGYFREPHWKSMGFPAISRVTWQVCIVVTN